MDSAAAGSTLREAQATVNTFYGGLCLGPSGPFEVAPGFSLPLGLPACTPTSTRNLTDVSDDYRKEVSKAAELGFKAELADRSVSINGAIYHTKVDDMQFFNFFAGPFGLLRAVTNLDEVTIKGAELDARWRATRLLVCSRASATRTARSTSIRAGPTRTATSCPTPLNTPATRARSSICRWGLGAGVRRPPGCQLRRQDLVPPGAERDRAGARYRVRLRAGELRQDEPRSL